LKQHSQKALHLVNHTEMLYQTDLQQLESRGHAMIRGAASENDFTQLRVETNRLTAAYPNQAHGIRDLLQKPPMIAAWSKSEHVLSFLPEGMQPVRAILFDKTESANWQVAWHQDLTIAVQEKREVPGYGPWSVKDGVVHVQPPIALLESMVTLRLHLDDTPAANGALKVVPGSHRHGRLDANAIAALRHREKEHICEAHAGDVLLMKPLILHASSASVNPGHRRVVHVEYARTELLDSALRWADSHR
jgi:hypothetical protein